MNKIISYLKYSGASVTITVNPYHWAWIPFFYFGSSEEVWDHAQTLKISILFFTIRIWFDDGKW